jgi:protein TonB
MHRYMICSPIRALVFAALALVCVESRAHAQDTSTTTTTTSAPVAHQPTTGAYWVSRPSAADFDRYYPEHARRRGLGGRAILDCLVIDGGTLTCTVAAEDPPGEGFGEAALSVSHAFRMSPTTTDGRSTIGGRMRVPITFWLR